jgi:Uma2 family endonuclease
MTTLNEYLTTSYEGSHEYIDGEVVPKNRHTLEQSRVQCWLVCWFYEHEAEWNINPLPSLSMQCAPERIRIPDVQLYEEGKVPRLVVELWSPEDTKEEYVERFTDYYGLGVENIWVVDPFTRRAFVIEDGEWGDPQNFLVVKDSPVYVNVAEMFERAKE